MFGRAGQLDHERAQERLAPEAAVGADLLGRGQRDDGARLRVVVGLRGARDRQDCGHATAAGALGGHRELVSELRHQEQPASVDGTVPGERGVEGEAGPRSWISSRGRAPAQSIWIQACPAAWRTTLAMSSLTISSAAWRSLPGSAWRAR
jgi:hypothetical protein